MNSKEIKGLVEAYTEVYAPTQEVDQFEDLSFVDDLSDNELVEIMEEILSEEEVTLQECLDVFDSEILFEESEMEKMNRLMNKRTREKKAAAATAKREKSAERERVGRKHALKRLQVAATRAGRNLADKAKKAGEKAKTLGAGAASAAAGGAAEAGRAAKSKLSSAKEKIKGLVKSGRKAVAGGLRKLASKVEPKETDGKEVKAAAKSAVSSGRKPAPYRIVGKTSGVSGSGGTKALPPVGKTKSGKTLTQSQRDMQTSQQNIRLAARLGEDLELFALQILEDLISEGYATNQQEALNVLESFSDCQVGDIVESYFGEEVSTDTYDLVLEYLYVEGYAETLEEAEWMMANELDAEDIDAILEAFKEPDLDRMRRQEDRHRTAAVRQRGGSRGSYKNRAMKMGSIRGALERGEDPRADGYGGKRAERGNPPEDHRAAFSKNPLNNPPRPVKKPGV